MATPSDSYEPLIKTLLDKLEAVRQNSHDHTEQDRRDALQRALRTELEGLDEEEARRRLDGVRAALTRKAREDESRRNALTSDLQRASSEAESLRAENKRLKEEISRLQSTSDRGDVLRNIKQGLSAVRANKEPTADGLNLPPGQVGFFQLAAELLFFALQLDGALLNLQYTFRVGVGGRGTSRTLDKLLKVFENQCGACLNEEKGSVEAVKATLSRNLRFVLEMYQAYDAAIGVGAKDLLAKLSPKDILGNKGVLGWDYPEAWNRFKERHGDLMVLGKDDIWSMFFESPFKERIGQYLDR